MKLGDDLEALVAETDALTEKSTPPKPPGEGWQMVFGKWAQTGKKSAAKEDPMAPKPPPPEETKPAPEKKKGKIARAKEKIKKAGGVKSALKKGAKKAAKAIKGLPKEVAKLMHDKDHRKEVGQKAAKAIRRKAKAVVADVKHEFKEFKDAGKAIGKLAKREKLTDHDKKAMKAAVMAIGMTVGGTIAMGGVGHLTAIALGQHFAAETAVKSIGKAALFAHILHESEGDEGAFDKWAEQMVLEIADRMENLGNMTPEQIETILSDVGGEEPEGEEDAEEPAEEPAGCQGARGRYGQEAKAQVRDAQGFR
jgi:hypothetical protein